MHPTLIRRRIYILLPLVLVLACIGSVNLSRLLLAPAMPETGSQTEDSEVTRPTPVHVQSPSAAATAPPANATRTVNMPTPTGTASLTPTPTIPPDGVIRLSGPPPESTFALDDTISFFWQWPYPLAEGQQLALILITDSKEVRLGSLPEPNFGTGFRWQAVPGEALSMDLDANSANIGPVQWLIRLETVDNEILLTSEERSLMLIAPRARGS